MSKYILTFSIIIVFILGMFGLVGWRFKKLCDTTDALEATVIECYNKQDRVIRYLEEHEVKSFEEHGNIDLTDMFI